MNHYRGWAIPGPCRRHLIRRRYLNLHTLLFFITFLTTTVAGAVWAGRWSDSWVLFFLRGTTFSIPLMAILLVHEMGHYLVGRWHRLDVTPPFFIPAPPPVGTFGAFIKIRSPIWDRTALVHIGASGPIAGSLLAVPLLVLGFFLSEVTPLTEQPVKPLSVSLGTSLILELICLARTGHFSSEFNVLLHPTALAAWFGLFVTAMNLLPIGQLDGGHVVYALFGPRVARIVSRTAFFSLIPLGVFVWQGWLVFAALVFFLGLKHPPPLDPYTPVVGASRRIGWAALALFVLTFVPVPTTVLE